MKISKFILMVLVGIITGCQSGFNPVQYVDPMIGTDGPGHTYPGVSLPFGMVQLSPDTRLTGWEGCSGYHYSDHFIYGFSHTHLSGTGALDYGDILISPTSGEPTVEEGSPEAPEPGYGSMFSHKNEKAEAGYYSVILDEGEIRCELTATQRVGFHRYTFKRQSPANIVLDLAHRDQVISSSMDVDGAAEVVGVRRSQSWAKDQYVYFVIQFSRPFRDYKLFDDGIYVPGTEANGHKLKAWFTFGTLQSNEVLVKVGISAVNIEGARKNLSEEIPGWNFNGIRKKAAAQWNRVLGKLEVRDGSEKQLRTFYTSMYHFYLNPNIYQDVDGNYRGRDLLVHQAAGYTNYTLFSLWDTYRAAHPLFTLLEPEITNDFINTFLSQYQQGGMLPVWELSANETGTMIGYHSVAVIADAYLKGIRGYDPELALEAMKNSADQDQLGLKYYKALGYIPGNEEGASVSKTLEYAYDDWCIAQMAKALGADSDYNRFIRRAQNYKNVFDPATGFMRAKMGAKWFAPFDPKEVNFNYTEANAWQYSFYVPQDISGLMQLMGGPKAFVNKLDTLFTTGSQTTGTRQADITGMIGQYAQGNEPSHHMAYLYDFAGEPWKTQRLVSQIMNELYTDQPDGLCGNEDCGQMSAWYLFSALGFYPVTPGTGQFIIGTPLFRKTEMHLNNNKTFTILAPNVSSTNCYIQQATLNGAPLERTYISYHEIMDGGVLNFDMGPEPNTDWGSQKKQLPVTRIVDHLILPVPFVARGDRTFSDHTGISLGCIDSLAEISYQVAAPNSLKMTVQKRYTQPFTIRNSKKVWFFASKGNQQTPVLSTDFHRISKDIRMKSISRYANYYSGGGDQALIDGLRGARNYRTGFWQGFEGDDLEAEIDLGYVRTVNRLKLSCLQDQRAWIFAPVWVDFWISRDEKDWIRVGHVVNDDLDPAAEGTFLKLYEADVYRSARYIKVKAKNLAVCPPWHPGAGGKAWIFADELIIE